PQLHEPGRRVLANHTGARQRRLLDPPASARGPRLARRGRRWRRAMSRARFPTLVILAALFAPPSAAQEPPAATTAEPRDLGKRRDLIGKEISVDDRVGVFLLHPGHDIDEVTLRRTPVVFRLPPRLRYRQSPGAPAARLQGILRREGGKLYCDVT